MSNSSMVLFGIVLTWLVVTTCAQFRFLYRKFSRIDFFRIIPIWTFFAPNPGVVDYHLIVRDRQAEGSYSSWTEVNIAADRNCFNFIWNPQKRAKKIILDAVQSLIIIASESPKDANYEVVSLPYILLLNIASHATVSRPPSAERQFVILQTSGHINKEINLAYVSQFHRVDAS